MTSGSGVSTPSERVATCDAERGRCRPAGTAQSSRPSKSVVTTELAAPVVLAFDLSLDIDLHLASMGASGERAVAGVTTGRIGLGEEVTWRATHFRRSLHHDQQDHRIGPPPAASSTNSSAGRSARSRHEHRFAEAPDGCRMTDRVSFDTPFGPIGRIAERVILGRYLRRLIEARNAYLAAAVRDRRLDAGRRGLWFGRTTS